MDIDPATPGSWQTTLQNQIDLEEGVNVSIPTTDCLASLMTDHFLVGADMQLITALSAPFDIRYHYLAGGIYQNSWRQWNAPDGEFVRTYIRETQNAGLLPMFSYYELSQTVGLEGPDELAKLTDPVICRDYLADWTYLCQTIGNAPCLLHWEPDLLGYAQKRQTSPGLQTIAVNTTGYANNLTGFCRRIRDIVRSYAPNTKIGIHASPWGSGIDIGLPVPRSIDVRGEAQKTGAFLLGCSAGVYDFIVVEASDRDAGYNGRWWDKPLYDQAFAWCKALTAYTNKPALWWQIPLGNAGTNYKDNRVDTFFARSVDVARTNAFGMVFGAGADGQATPENDNGNLVLKTISFARQAPCP